jgi:hypothetical protein
MKTNAARLLDTMSIRYQLRDYDPGDDHLADYLRATRARTGAIARAKD